MLRRYYGKISKLPIDQFVGHDGELVVDDLTGRTYVMDGVTLGGHELVGATPRYEINPPTDSIPGALWYDPTSGRLFIYYNSQWVDAAPNTTYVLPHASASTLGGIKVGNNLTIDPDGVLNAEDGNYTLPVASDIELGGIKVGLGLSIDDDGVLTADSHTPNELINGDNVLSLDEAGIVTFPNGFQIGNVQSYGDGLSTVLIDPNGITLGTTVGNEWYFDTDGNLTVPENSTIKSQSENLYLHAPGNVNILGNLYITSNVHAGNFTTPTGSTAGFRFANLSTGDDRTGVFHLNLSNQLVLQHQGNIGVRVNANGTTDINYINSINSVSSNIYVGNVSAGNIKANLTSAGTGITKGYKFFDPTEGFTTTGLIHNSGLNQIQLIHESNIGIAVTSNGTTLVSDTFSFNKNGIITIPNNGVINYSNGQSILNGITSGSGTNTQPSSTPPVSPTSGQLWYDTNSGKIFVYLNDAWIDTSPVPSMAIAAPAHANSVGHPGQIAYDSTHVYVCVATNTWKRSLLSTW